MIDHTGFPVSDVDKAKTFYEAALKPLGLKMTFEVKGKVVGFGEDHSEFMVNQGEPRRDHIAFTATDKEAVNTFHTKAIEAGGIDNGAPGYRKNYSPGHYAAYVRDSEGNNIEAVFRDPNPSE
jgi:catechol 2,3-dioxygenase-like lactoylglutathione lyase family enzyme